MTVPRLRRATFVLGLLFALSFALLKAPLAEAKVCPEVTRTFSLFGAIATKYQALGGSDGFLGCQTQTQLTTPNGLGQYAHFEGGSIYWKSSVSGSAAFEVHGLIRSKWAALGWENSILGFPTSDELSTSAQTGKFNNFEGGAIFWRNNTSTAYEIHGSIRAQWQALGSEIGVMGFPVSDEFDAGGGRRASNFQFGTIYFTSTHGTYVALSGPARTVTFPVRLTVTDAGVIGGRSHMRLVGSGFAPNREIKFFYDDPVNGPSLVATRFTDANGRIDTTQGIFCSSIRVSSGSMVFNQTIRAVDASGRAAVNTTTLYWSCRV